MHDDPPIEPGAFSAPSSTGSPTRTPAVNPVVDPGLDPGVDPELEPASVPQGEPLPGTQAGDPEPKVDGAPHLRPGIDLRPPSAPADVSVGPGRDDPSGAPADDSLTEAPLTSASPPTDPAPAEPGDRPPAPMSLSEPAAPPPRLDPPRIIAVANQKGGVGKTTTAVNLGAALADLGYRTLVIDLDPQANASSGLGIPVRDLDRSMYDVLLEDLPIAACIVATDVENLAVAPASLELAGAEIELVPAMSRELKLRSALAAVRGDYDYVLIDCPPSLGLLTVNALAAATEVLVPIQCEYYALEGVGQLVQNVALVQRNLNPVLEVSTVVLVMYDARTKLADQVAQEVRNHFREKVCRTVVPRTVRLSEAPSYGQPITAFDGTSRGAIAYRALAEEVSHGTA